MRIKLDWGQSKEPSLPDGLAITKTFTPHECPGIRVKITGQWRYEDSSPKWISYSLPAGSAPQILKVQYPRASKRPARSIPLTEEQAVHLAGLLAACQTRLPGEVMGGGCCDGDLVELTLTGLAISASYTWDGSAPHGWEGLGEVVDFFRELAGEGYEG